MDYVGVTKNFTANVAPNENDHKINTRNRENRYVTWPAQEFLIRSYSIRSDFTGFLAAALYV
jgi:hypothetical protein